MQILNNIPFELDIDELLQKSHIESGTDTAKEYEELLEKVRKAGNPKAVYKESFIDDKGKDTVTIEGVTFASAVLRMNLDAVGRVFFYVCTCGTELDKLDIPEGDYLKEYWIDHLKAVLLGASRRHLTKILKEKYKLEKTSSMAPGSGDVDVWPIEQQKELFSLFGNVKELIGVRLTDSCLMLPNKSVSGLVFPTEKSFQTCQLCHRKVCQGRRAPFDQELWDSVHN